MLYYFFDWLAKTGIRVPGGGLFQFLTFRMMMAILFSLLITMVFGKRVINLLKKLQIGESVRELGLAGEQQKKGTPTMGGIIILLGILIPTLLFADLNKVYIRLMLLSTVWLGAVGFLDDYLKLKAKKRIQQGGVEYKKTNKDGLSGWLKVIGQIGLGIVIGLTLYFSPKTKHVEEHHLVFGRVVGFSRTARSAENGIRRPLCTVWAPKSVLVLVSPPPPRKLVHTQSGVTSFWSGNQ